MTNSPLKITVQYKNQTRWFGDTEATLTVEGIADKPVLWNVLEAGRQIELTPDRRSSAATLRIVDEPVYWKWFPWLPAYNKKTLLRGEETLLKFDHRSVEYPNGKIELFSFDSNLLRWGTRHLKSIGYLFEYEQFPHCGIGRIEDKSQLDAALALSAYFWSIEEHS